MKNKLLLFLVSISLTTITTYAQTVKAPASCKIYLEGKKILDATKEDVLKWGELTPPQVQCDDGKVYNLESFRVSYLSLKPFMKHDFGIGEGGIPIMAREKIKKGQSGDTLVLEDVTYTDDSGTKQTLPVISVKIN